MSENQDDHDFAIKWVNAELAGDLDTVWELDEISNTSPTRALALIQAINRVPIADEVLKEFIDGFLGCGPLENIIAILSDQILDEVLRLAAHDSRLQKQLSCINPRSITDSSWMKIQKVIGGVEN